MLLTAGDAACSIFDLEISDENKKNSLTWLRETGLEPVSLVNDDPLVAVAVSTAKINKKLWRFLRLPNDLVPEIESSTAPNNEEQFESISSDPSGPLIPLSRTAILDLTRKIMPKQSIPGVTDTMFLSENEVYEIVRPYLQNDTIKQNELTEWMNKDGFWGPSEYKQVKKVRKCGRVYNVITPKYRDFTWSDISNIHQFRTIVKATRTKVYTIGYARKSPTPEPLSSKLKTVNLQIYKLRNKLLCEDVFASIGTTALDPIVSRDYNIKK